MNKRIVIIVALIALVAIVAGVVLGWQNAAGSDYSHKYEGVDLSADVGEITRDDTYSEYLLKYQHVARPEQVLKIDVLSYTEGSGAQQIADPVNPTGADVLLSQENSEITWTFHVEEEGLYRLAIEYCPVESRGIAAERSVLINGEIPFRGADYQTFQRLWTDASSEPKYGNQGNQIRPQQVEIYRWSTKMASDDTSGYETEPYAFYFRKGENTLTLVGVNEPLALRSISLLPVQANITYEDYLGTVSSDNATEPWLDVIQGEQATLRSEQSLYATYDRSSPTTQPLSLSNTILNIIGGNSWTINGQWIEWEIEVPEDGWYNLAIKGRQNYNRGQSAIRSLQIDGSTPFVEAEQIKFQYSNDWQIKSLGDENGDYCFYLTKGTHTMRLTVALGEKGSTIRKIEDSVYRLNQMYRQLLVLMGRTPDRYRDYHVSQTYPDLADAMRACSL